LDGDRGLSRRAVKVLSFRVVVSDPKTGRAVQIVVKGDSAKRLLGKKIGDVFRGSILAPEDIEIAKKRERGGEEEPGEEKKKAFQELVSRLSELTLKITGGSDDSGFPMRPDLPGGAKRRLLLSGPPGYHPPEKGMRKRVTVRGNTITEDIVQINTVIVYPEEAE